MHAFDAFTFVDTRAKIREEHYDGGMRRNAFTPTPDTHPTQITQQAKRSVQSQGLSALLGGQYYLHISSGHLRNSYGQRIHFALCLDSLREKRTCRT